ncbi:MAG: zf-HC2 domain-containing protein [Peptococcaceae bacterium]|nr:zf-HC2 domain-containing protein [Peptococcaceae bacterium]
MQCHEIQELLSAHIDGMLDPSMKKKVDIHLDQCPACRSEYDDLRMVVSLIRELPMVVPPAHFRGDLRRKLELVAGQRRQVSWIQRLARGRWSVVMATAASFLLVIGIAAVWSGLPGRDELLMGKSARVESYNDKKETAPVEVFSGAKGADGALQSPASGTADCLRIDEYDKSDSDTAYSVRRDSAPASAEKDLPPVTPLANQENSTQERKLAVENGMAGVTARGVAAVPPAGPAEQPQQVVIDLKVEQRPAAVREILNIARKYGGEALVLPDTGCREILVKVPVARLEQTVADIGKTGKITGQGYPVPDENKEPMMMVATADTPAPAQKGNGIEEDCKDSGDPGTPAPGPDVRLEVQELKKTAGPEAQELEKTVAPEAQEPGATAQPASPQGEDKKKEQGQPAVNGGIAMATIRVRLE